MDSGQPPTKEDNERDDSDQRVTDGLLGINLSSEDSLPDADEPLLDFLWDDLPIVAQVGDSTELDDLPLEQEYDYLIECTEPMPNNATIASPNIDTGNDELPSESTSPPTNFPPIQPHGPVPPPSSYVGDPNWKMKSRKLGHKYNQPWTPEEDGSGEEDCELDTFFEVSRAACP